MKNLKIVELKKRVANLLELERVAANKALKESIKKKDDDIMIISQSYLMGLKRIQELLNKLFREIRDE